MWKRLILGILLYFSFLYLAYAHTYKLSVVVDTDMALDDIRAIVMLLNSDLANIPLMVTADGSVAPERGIHNLKNLLMYFKRDDILIAVGRSLGKSAPPWRSWCEKLIWPIEGKNYLYPSAAQEIVKVINNSKGNIIYLCLGPLTNLADALKLDIKIKNKISCVIYLGGHPKASFSGWNTKRDIDAARFVFNSGLNIYSICLPRKDLLLFDKKFFTQIKLMDTPAAHLITKIFKLPTINKLLSKNHFYIWDEMSVIYLHAPSLFKFIPTNNSNVMSLVSFEKEKISKIYLKLLSYSADFHLSPRHTVVLNDFPKEPSFFKEDIKPYVNQIIEKYGLEEWKTCILTSEFHRHLGIYSLIGAKMGIRAREILEAPFDSLKVISLAGNKPPLSCMNDGLQVSTGASLGRGNIQISNQKSQPAAIFIYKNKKLTLRLKSLLVEKISKDIKTGLKKFGGLNQEYFKYIRKLGIKYWLELDRREIFEETLQELDLSN